MQVDEDLEAKTTRPVDGSVDCEGQSQSQSWIGREGIDVSHLYMEEMNLL